MTPIKLKEMIITCESCGNVKRFHVKSQLDCENIFKTFKCENNCDRAFFSYISVGLLERENYFIPKINMQFA